MLPLFVVVCIWGSQNPILRLVVEELEQILNYDIEGVVRNFIWNVGKCAFICKVPAKNLKNRLSFRFQQLSKMLLKKPLFYHR